MASMSERLNYVKEFSSVKYIIGPLFHPTPKGSIYIFFFLHGAMFLCVNLSLLFLLVCLLFNV